MSSYFFFISFSEHRKNNESKIGRKILKYMDVYHIVERFLINSTFCHENLVYAQVFIESTLMFYDVIASINL